MIQLIAHDLRVATYTRMCNAQIDAVHVTLARWCLQLTTRHVRVTAYQRLLSWRYRHAQ